MIKGHGDDAYQYTHIVSDFSSNICAGKGHQALMGYLAAHPELASHYPEPEAWSLERLIAEQYDLAPEQVIVTNGRCLSVVSTNRHGAPHALALQSQQPHRRRL